MFKIQANMDPKHRDRIAFMAGQRLQGHEAKPALRQAVTRNPQLFLAQDRATAEELAGDIIGIPNHGNLRIGDALTEGENIAFTGIPSFAQSCCSRSVRPIR